MSAVSNPLNYFSDTPVAVPLVLGASNRTFNALPGAGLLGRLIGKQVVPELAEKIVKENADDLAKVAAKQY